MASVPDYWLTQIAGAATTQEVVGLARDYAEALTESERMRLPSSCLPPSLKSVQEVNEYALVLTRAHLAFRGALSSSLMLERLMLFFATASGRIAQIERISRTRSPTPDFNTQTGS